MNPSEKAHILVEALPYIRKWWGKTVVIKVGGEILNDEATLPHAEWHRLEAASQRHASR